MKDRSRSSSLWLITAIPVLAFLQIVAGSLHDLTGLGMSIPDRSAANETPVVPAVYAFAIWGPIFLWSAAFAVFQALPDQRNSSLLSMLRGPAALAFGMNGAWEVNAQLSGLGWTSFALIVGVLLPLLAMVERVRTFAGPIEGRDLWLAVVPLHILAGWISVAAFASLSTTIDVVGNVGLGVPPTWRDMLIVVLAGTIGAVFTLRARSPWPYAITVGWGLVGIMVKNTVEVSNPEVAAATVVALLLVVGASLATFRSTARVRHVAASYPT